MRKGVWLMILLAAATTAGAGGRKVSAGDIMFGVEMSSMNLYALQAGRLAEKKASSPAVKKFAAMMVAQHNEISESYAPLCAQGFATTKDLGSERQKMYDQLVAARAGREFDALYKEQLMQTHTELIALFAKQKSGKGDRGLREFAARWLPSLEHHLLMARRLPQ